MPMQAVTKDMFANPFFTTTFVRDASGRITGCSVSSGRAWNNDFVKLAERNPPSSPGASGSRLPR